jgi:hypothetical protein
MVCDGGTALTTLDLPAFFGLTSVLNCSSGRTARKGTWDDMWSVARLFTGGVLGWNAT